MERAAAPRRGGDTAWRRRVPPLPALLLLALGGVAFLAYRFDPSAVDFFPKCLFFSATGLACPGCGSTRALHALLHLDVAAAFRFNPLPFFLLPAGALWLALGRALPSSRVTRALPWVLAGAIVAFTIWRNLPGYPFEQLSHGLRSPFVAAVR